MSDEFSIAAKATPLAVGQRAFSYKATTIMAGLTGNFLTDLNVLKVKKLALSAKNFCGLCFTIHKSP